MTVARNGHGGTTNRLSRLESVALELPPHDADAELGLLAAENYEPGLHGQLGVARGDFYTQTAREIFDALESMRLARAPISFETVRRFVRALPSEAACRRGKW
jgi:hypothetical protein